MSHFASGLRQRVPRPDDVHEPFMQSVNGKSGGDGWMPKIVGAVVVLMFLIAAGMCGC